MAEKTRVNAAGYIEGYDDETGELLWTQKTKKDLTNPIKKRGRPPGRPTFGERDTHHYVLDAAGRKLWVPKGTDASTLPRTIWPFNEVTADNICLMVQEGHTLGDIGKMEGMPSFATIMSWSRKYPQFREELAMARKLRAEFYADEAIRVARQSSEGTSKSDRVKVDALKWGASVGDADQFGTKTKLTGDPNAPISFIIATGVPDALPEPKDVPSEVEDTE